MAIVKAPLALFEMQIKGMTGHTIELLQPPLGKTPKAFDAVDVVTARGKFISTMIDPEMFGITNVDQAVVATLTVAVDSYFRRHAASNNGLQRGFAAVRHDFGVDPSLPLEQPKDWGLTGSSTPAFATHAAGTKVAFIDLDFTRCKRRLPFARLGDALSDFEIDGVHTLGRQARQSRRIRSAQILGKTARQLTKLPLRNMGTVIIPVLPCHSGSFSPFSSA